MTRRNDTLTSPAGMDRFGHGIDNPMPGHTQKNASATMARFKTGLAILLAIVFCVVIFQPTKTDPASPDSAGADVAQDVSDHAAQRALPDTVSLPPKNSYRVLSLPPIDLNHILAHNPFSPPQQTAAELVEGSVHSSSQESMVSGIQAEMSEANQSAAGTFELPRIKVDAILTGNGRPVALVDNRFVYVNDVLENHWRIVAIRSTGLVLEPLSSDEGP